MADLADIREALAASLASIPNLHQSGYLLANPTPPFAEVYPVAKVYDRAMQRGLDVWHLNVRVGVGMGLSLGAQRSLDAFIADIGTSSIKAAIEDDRTLGGVVEFVRVTRCDAYRMFERQGSSAVLGAEWEVEVLARGDT